VALPADDVKFAVTQLRAFGRVRPGWFGAGLQEVTPDLANAFGVKMTHGALVAALSKSSPAEAAACNRAMSYSSSMIGHPLTSGH
jgi:serine protease Do